MAQQESKQMIVGLDIGTSKVVAVVGEIDLDGGMEVVGIGSHPSRGMKKGVVVNIESTVNAIQRAVEEAELPKAAVKVLLNLALIAGDTLVRGGTVTIGTEEGEHTTEIVLRAEGPRVILDPDLRATLTDGSGGESVTPRAAAAFLVHAIVADAGGSVMVTDPVDNTLLFGATLPSRLA